MVFKGKNQIFFIFEPTRFWNWNTCLAAISKWAGNLFAFLVGKYCNFFFHISSDLCALFHLYGGNNFANINFHGTNGRKNEEEATWSSCSGDIMNTFWGDICKLFRHARFSYVGLNFNPRPAYTILAQVLHLDWVTGVPQNLYNWNIMLWLIPKTLYQKEIGNF